MGEEMIATLVEPNRYPRHLGQVAALTTEHLVVLKRKFVSRAGYEIHTAPLSGCARVRYRDERPIPTMVGGALILAIVAGVLVMLVLSWKDLEPGTRVPIGALAVAGLYGSRWLFGARRHRLVFAMTDGTSLAWTSLSGEFAKYKAEVDRVVEFARSRDLLDSNRLVRR
jgi:hypothetical protein